jgi:Omp85 superfamily domain
MAGAVIGEVRVLPGDVFDPAVAGEDGWLYRTANRLHIETRPSVIRDQLLFQPGDRYEHRLVLETERILRANDYLYDADVVPVAWDGQRVDLEVRTRDVWTLNPGVSFTRKGGENTFGAQIQEDNLLGRGQKIDLEWKSGVDRESVLLTYFNPHFLESFTRLTTTYVDSDDGNEVLLRLERPFYALDVRRAGGGFFAEGERIESRYARGDVVGEFGHRDEYYEFYGGWSRGLQGRGVRRWTAGMAYERDRFEPVAGVATGGPLPGDRELLYPWIALEWVEDSFRERVNLNQIRRTEDVLVGLRGFARVGYASDAAGSDRDAIVASAYVQDGIELPGGEAVFGSLSASGRLEDGTLRNGVLAAEGRLYWPTSKYSTFFAGVSGAATEDLDAESQLLLGGDNGLRGYPLRYQAGTSRALLTLEQRYYTKWYPFRLFHVGAAAFFDAGRTWGRDVTGLESDGLLKDVGVGLRLGSSRSSFGNVIHIDLAFPLDGGDDIDSVQLLVQTKGQF